MKCWRTTQNFSQSGGLLQQATILCLALKHVPDSDANRRELIERRPKTMRP